MNLFRKILSMLLIVLLLVPTAISFADDNDGTSASLTGGSSSSGDENPPEQTVTVGDESVITADPFDGSIWGEGETDTEESSSGSHTGVDATVVQAQINDRKILDHIARRLQKYSGKAPVAYQPPIDWLGLQTVETVQIPVSELQQIAEEGSHISPYSKPRPDKQDEVKERAPANKKKNPWLDDLDILAMEGTEDFRLWLQYVLALGSGNIKAGAWPCPLPDVDIDALLESLASDPAMRQAIEEALETMHKLDSTTIQGMGGGRIRIKDYYTYHDRYDALKQYLFLCSISDTVAVQHIIEIDMNSCSRSVTVAQEAQPYPAGLGYGDGTAMYAWAIECLDSPFANDIGTSAFVGTSNDQFFPWKFTTTGRYKFTFSQNIVKTTRRAVSYNCYERWVIAQTGQTIYERHSTGRINNANDGLNRAEGREKDRLVGYTSFGIDQAVFSEYNEYGISGRQMGVRILNVVGDPNQIIPDTSVINNGSSTYRLE